MSKVLINSQGKVITYQGLAVIKPTILPIPIIQSYGARCTITKWDQSETLSSGIITVTVDIALTISLDLQASNNTLVMVTMQTGYNFITWPTGTYTLNGAGSYPIYYEANGPTQTYIDFNNAAKNIGDIVQGTFTFTARRI